MFAHSYAKHIPAHIRIGRFIADQENLAWIFHFLNTFPHSDILIVGGTARDAVLGKIPNDIHLLVHGTPESQLNNYKQAKKIPQDLDIKLPSNKLTTHHTLPIIHDLAGRDVTVNSLAYSIRNGKLYDHFNGLKDVSEKSLNTIGNPLEKLSSEPHLIPRLLRLAAQLNFGLNKPTISAILNHGPILNQTILDEENKAHFLVKRSDISREFIKGLKAEPARTFKLFFDGQIFRHIAPEIHQIEKLTGSNGDSSLNNLLSALELLKEKKLSNELTLAVIIAFFEEETSKILEVMINKLNLPLLEKQLLSFEKLIWLIKNYNLLKNNNQADISDSQLAKMLTSNYSPDLLSMLDIISLVERNFAEREKLLIIKDRKNALQDRIYQPKLLRGKDLIALGFEPGPHMRNIFNQIRTAQLSGQLTSRLEALELARSWV